MASQFVTLSNIGRSRNPVQETDYRRLLDERGIQYKEMDGHAFPLSGAEIAANTASAAQAKIDAANQAALAQKAKDDAIAKAKEDKWKSDRDAFNTRQKGEGEAFITEFKTQYPTILQNIEQDLALPELRADTHAGFQELKDKPGDIRQAMQGRDVSANQLNRMIQARKEDFYPELSERLSAQQFAEAEFGRQAGRELIPYQTEFQMLADGWAREATGFNIDMEGQLNILLSQLNNGVQLSLAQMNQATQLAQLEQNTATLMAQISAAENLEQMKIDAGAYDKPEPQPQFDFLNLGDQYQVMQDGQPVGSYPIGLAPKRPGDTNISGDMGNYFGTTLMHETEGANDNWIYQNGQWFPRA